MTLNEMTSQIEQLSLDEQLILLEMLTRTIRNSLRGAEISRARGLLASDEPSPSDSEVEDAYLEYIDEKYR